MKQIYLVITFLSLSLSGFSQQAYYNSIDFTKSGIALKDDLAVLITSTHTNYLSYSEIWTACEFTDEDPNNSANVLLIYGFDDTDGIPNTDISRLKSLHTGSGSSVGTWNREHTYAKSLGNPNLETSGPGSDAHHLRAADAQRNGTRSSLKFITGSGTSSVTGSGWYPGDQWKGDVARMMMYMWLRYGNQCTPSGVAIGTANTVEADMINLLLDWNAQDPVSQIERTRNTFHENTANAVAQGNRNPFIDEPYLATRIWGGTPAEDTWAIYGGMADTTPPSDVVNLLASNPTATTIDLTWDPATDNVGVASYDIYQDNVYAYNTTGTSFTVTGLANTTNFCFTIKAKDIAANASVNFSNQSCATTLAGGGGGAGGSCANEDFENIPANDSGYVTRTWTGVDGIASGWTATSGRTDQTLTTRAITLRDGVLTSPSLPGGISDLTVSTQRAFTGGSGVYEVFVNGVSKGTVPYDATVQTTTISNINVSGNISIVFSLGATGATSDRVKFDDLSWTCFDVAAVNDYNLSSVTLYPNPVNGNTLFVNTQETIKVTIFDILGKTIQISQVSQNNNEIGIADLQKGIYLVKLENANGAVTKKLVKH